MGEGVGGGGSIDEIHMNSGAAFQTIQVLSNVLILIKRSDLLIFDIKKLSYCLVDNIGLIDYFKQAGG